MFSSNFSLGTIVLSIFYSYFHGTNTRAYDCVRLSLLNHREECRTTVTMTMKNKKESIIRQQNIANKYMNRITSMCFPRVQSHVTSVERKFCGRLFPERDLRATAAMASVHAEPGKVVARWCTAQIKVF